MANPDFSSKIFVSANFPVGKADPKLIPAMILGDSVWQIAVVETPTRRKKTKSVVLVFLQLIICVIVSLTDL